MRAADVKLKDLNTYDECDDAVEGIEGDYRNLIGGVQAWNSGRQTYLTSAAKAKVSAIQKRAVNLSSDDAEEE